MSTFDVQSVESAAPFSTAFRYIADTANLPEWTHAFKRASENQATLETPGGAVHVGLRVEASEPHGTVDWTITFPDGAVSRAASRVISHTVTEAFTRSCSRRLQSHSSGSRVHSPSNLAFWPRSL